MTNVVAGAKRGISFCVYALAASVLCGVWTPWIAIANPTGENVVAGQGNFNRSGSTLTVTQGTDRMIVNWHDFSINPWETTRFVQPGINSTALNRVTGGNPSSLLGTLQANGNVFLINPNGIVVGSGARIDAGGFLASTLDISDAQFMAGGTMNFLGPSTASVQNFGVINATNGDVILIGQEVINHGSINAPNGTAGLAAGSDIVLMPQGGGGAEGRLSVRVKESELGIRKGEKGVTNTGKINAATAELKAAGGNAYALAINNTGMVRANTLQNRGGRIFLSTDGGKIVNKGTLQAKGGRVVVSSASRNRSRPLGSPGSKGITEQSGVIDVSNRDAGQKGGTVQILGDQVYVLRGASIDASGYSGGGEVLTGGDFQGKNANVLNAQKAFIDAGVELHADATHTGDGGKVIVWSDELTVISAATLSAKGGPAGGNGGLIETSGKEDLIFAPREINVAAQSPNGGAGQILLDPTNITIQTGGSDTAFNLIAFADAPINIVLDPANVVALSGNVSLQATNDITINDALNFSQGPGQRIAFQAGNNINVNANIFTAGADIYLEANSPHTGPGPARQLSFAGGVVVNATGGEVNLNGLTFVFGAGSQVFGHIIYINQGPNLSTLTVGPGIGDFPEAGLASLNAPQVYLGKNFSAGVDQFGTSSLALFADDVTIHGSASPYLNSNLGLLTVHAITSISFPDSLTSFATPVQFTSLGTAAVLFAGPTSTTITSGGTDIRFDVPLELGTSGGANFISTNGGNLRFNAAVNSAFGPGTDSLTINTGIGTTQFNASVGGTFSLDQLNITNAGDVLFNSTVNVNSLSQSGGTQLTHFGDDVHVLSGSLSITTNNIQVSGLLNVTSGAVNLQHTGTLHMDGASNVLSMAFTEFGGATTLGAGANVQASGTILFAGSSITLHSATADSTTADILFSGPVTLQGSSILNAVTDISFLSTLQGPGSLTAFSGSIFSIFGAPGSTPAGDLDITAPSILIQNGFNAANATFSHSGTMLLGGTSVLSGTLEDSGGGFTTLGDSMTPVRITANGGAVLNNPTIVASPLTLNTSGGLGGISFLTLIGSASNSVTLNAGSGNINVADSALVHSWSLTGNNVSLTQTDDIVLESATVTQLLSLRTGGAISQTGAINVNRLTMSADSTITLGNTGNKVLELGDVTRGGDFYLYEDPGLTISGQINTGNLLSNVTIVSIGGDLTLAEGANIAVDGTANKVTLATDGYLINNAGTGVFTLTNGAVFNLYAGSDLHTDLGGLSTDFVVYSQTYPAADEQIPGGNGIFFANSLATSLSATGNTSNSGVLDAFMDAGISQLDIDQPEMDFPMDTQLDLLSDGLGDFSRYDAIVARNEAILLAGGDLSQVGDTFLPSETRSALDPAVEQQLAGVFGAGEPNPPVNPNPQPGQPAPGEAPGLLTQGQQVVIDNSGITNTGNVPQETKEALADTAENELDKAMVQATGFDGTAPFDQVLGAKENSVLDATGVNGLPPAQTPPELTGAIADSIEQELAKAMNSGN
ncbi:MAG TPA: filamentous hemagglutinin N-terminal domain-containing protein [Candidatus Methylacidiphilales bacterium]|nr:filamentous hemagglutinin N-terminal domain-containing protein [Candidatus Methylacidiphilales bacterium]